MAKILVVDDEAEVRTLCGAVATLEKPFSLEQLRETIGPLLRLHR